MTHHYDNAVINVLITHYTTTFTLKGIAYQWSPHTALKHVAVEDKDKVTAALTRAGFSVQEGNHGFEGADGFEILAALGDNVFFDAFREDSVEARGHTNAEIIEVIAGLSEIRNHSQVNHG